MFQEDELTLIIAGGVLGAFAGLLQWWVNVFLERRAAANSLRRGVGPSSTTKLS